MSAVTERHVLVLNRLWQAVNVCTVERALTLLFMGHAQVVDPDGESFNTYSFREWCDFTSGGADAAERAHLPGDLRAVERRNPGVPAG